MIILSILNLNPGSTRCGTDFAGDTGKVSDAIPVAIITIESHPDIRVFSSLSDSTKKRSYQWLTSCEARSGRRRPAQGTAFQQMISDVSTRDSKLASFHHFLSDLVEIVMLQ